MFLVETLLLLENSKIEGWGASELQPVSSADVFAHSRDDAAANAPEADHRKVSIFR